MKVLIEELKLLLLMGVECLDKILAKLEDEKDLPKVQTVMTDIVTDTGDIHSVLCNELYKYHNAIVVTRCMVIFDILTRSGKPMYVKDIYDVFPPSAKTFKSMSSVYDGICILLSRGFIKSVPNEKTTRIAYTVKRGE